MKTTTTTTMTLKEWHMSPQKYQVWMDYIHDRTSVNWHLRYWFYWIAYFIEPKIKAVIDSINSTKTQDPRYIDQLVQMSASAQEALETCQRALVEKKCHSVWDDEFPCRLLQERFVCYSSWHKRERINGVLMCGRAKDAIVEDACWMLRGLLVSWLSGSYLVWKLYQQKRIQFPVFVSETHMDWLPFDDISSWEIVCGDEEKEILSHPLLPHPSDFMEKREITGTTYADKARFEYQIPGTLQRHLVVLTKKPSVVPRIRQHHHHDEHVDECPPETKTPAEQPSFSYQESTHSHKQGSKKKKRLLSRILKEGRKKHKKQWRKTTTKVAITPYSPVEEDENYYQGVGDYEYYYISNWEEYSCGSSRNLWDLYDYDRYSDY